MATTSTAVSRIFLGFVAGAIAVVTAHQAVLWGLAAAGLLPATTRAWSLAAHGPLGVPMIVNSMFWGGLWGALFGLVWDKLPGGALWVRGLLYGILITLVSNFTLLPLIRRALGVTNAAQTTLFAGGDPVRIASVVTLLGAFGIATAIIYGLMTRAR